MCRHYMYTVTQLLKGNIYNTGTGLELICIPLANIDQKINTLFLGFEKPSAIQQRAIKPIDRILLYFTSSSLLSLSRLLDDLGEDFY